MYIYAYIYVSISEHYTYMENIYYDIYYSITLYMCL